MNGLSYSPCKTTCYLQKISLERGERDLVGAGPLAKGPHQASQAPGPGGPQGALSPRA